MDYTLENIKTLDRGVNKLFSSAIDDSSNKEYEEIATVVTSKARIQSYAWLGDIPSMKEWVDERQKAKLEDYKYDIEKKDWETSFYVTRDDFMFDGLGIVATKVETLNHAVNDHYNEIVGELITANGDCFDGQPFFGEHELGEFVYNNTSGYKLTKDNFFAVARKMKGIKKTNGKTMRVKQTLVLHALDLEQQADVIFKSALVDGSTNESYGKVKTKVMDDMAPGTWCVIDNSRPVKPFILQITKKAEKVDRLTQNPLEGKKIYYGIDTMDNAGYGFWQLAHFCDGSGSEDASAPVEAPAE
ncbi:hypothetical protein AB835_04665 [Candidatus Endobugula sertula]|uniref:Bacteriophage Mu GpT domain-containing protein n=1 Tax=Candidatus Endobugula sertula TaxID=62101 RepID=A0A1D2QRF9_9GAMM|nr:hypothetical protein AB835_04665 [Candidatus Endobugula sertula]